MFFKKNLLVTILFIVCQVIMITGVIFVYGLIAAKVAYGDNGLLYKTYAVTPKGMDTISGVEKSIQDIQKDVNFIGKIDYISICLDHGGVPVIANSKYIEKPPLFINVGEYFSKKEYNSGENLIILNPQLENQRLKLLHEAENGDENEFVPVKFNVGGEFNLFGTNYIIKGLTFDLQHEIPYTSIESLTQKYYVKIIMKENQSKNDILTNGKIIRDAFNADRITPPTVKTNETNEKLAQSILAFVIAFVATINLSALYKYVLSSRKREYAIYRICGCRKTKGFMLYFLEMLLICVGIYIFTAILFQFGLSWVYSYMQDGAVNALTFEDYAVLFGLYVLNILVVLVPSLKKYSNGVPLDIYRF